MAHSHSLPTSDFCSPLPSTPLWHALCVGVDLITMSFFKVLLCLLVDNVSIVTSEQAQSSASHPGLLFIATSSSTATNLVPKERSCRFYVGSDGAFSQMRGCV